MANTPYKQYLGDSVYADFDERGRGIVLTTENGLGASNTIFLDDTVLTNLENYVNWLKSQLAAKVEREAQSKAGS